MLRYISEIWMEHVNKSGVAESLLTLDRFAAHISESSTQKFQENLIHTCVIPGGCTSILQPLVVCLNKPFKNSLRNSWQQYMIDETDKLQETDNIKIPPPSRQHIVDWVETAWRAIAQKKDQVAKSFLVTGISNTSGQWEESLIRNEDVMLEIEKEMKSVFGEKQMAYESDGDPFDQVSSSSDEECMDLTCSPSSASSIDRESICCGEFSEITDVGSDN